MYSCYIYPLKTFLSYSYLVTWTLRGDKKSVECFVFEKIYVYLRSKHIVQCSQ